MRDHYKPEKPLFLISIDQIELLSKQETNIAIMHYSNISKKNGLLYYQMSCRKVEYAKSLYSTLHEIDNTSVEKIYVEMPPNSIEWNDIIDRLGKASVKL